MEKQLSSISACDKALRVFSFHGDPVIKVEIPGGRVLASTLERIGNPQSVGALIKVKRTPMRDRTGQA
jgi:hypothetical protein